MTSNAGFRILAAPPRLPARLLKQARSIPTSHLSDSMHRMFGVGAAIRPFHRRGKLVGCAFTVRVPAGDNLMVHKALDLAQPGDVIVVDATGALANAIIGEIMTRYAARRGLAGFVIDGAIRDLDAISTGTFPVFARGVTHRGPYKNGPGEINVDVTIGEQVVRPGDLVVGDADGVIALPRGEAEQVLAAAVAHGKIERRVMKDIDAGRLDRAWVDESIASKGLGP